MPSPTKRPHSISHGWIYRLLAQYEEATPGTEAHLTASSLLGPVSEPMPDVSLLISPNRGGQTTTKDEYIVGAPELIVEVASSTEAIDLHAKKADYERAGVQEYLVLAIRQKRLFWFILREEQYHELAPGPDGILRSEVFPGLWIDPAALVCGDLPRLRSVLNAGLATPEHAAFVARLAGAAGEGKS